MPEAFTLTPEQVRELAFIRTERRARIKDAFAASRQRTVQIKKVRKAMTASETPMTIPELGEATGIALPDVLWCVTAMKKYGIVGERDNDGGYYRYALEEAGADVPADDDE